MFGYRESERKFDLLCFYVMLFVWFPRGWKEIFTNLLLCCAFCLVSERMKGTEGNVRF